MKKRILLTTISIVLLGSLIYFSGPVEIWNSLQQANPFYLIYIILVVVFYLFVRVLRWRYLLEKTDIELGWIKCIKYFLSAMSIANVTPLKSGEAFRGYYVKKLDSESFTETISTVFFERLCDILVMITIAVFGLLWLTLLGQTMGWMWLGVIVYMVIVIVSIYIVFSDDRLEPILKKLSKLFTLLPFKGLEKKIDKFGRDLSDSLNLYRSKKVICLTLFFTLVVWTIHALVGYFAFMSLGYQIPYPIALLVVVISPLLSALTFLPLGLGSNEIIAVTIYSIFLEISLPTITTAVIITRILDSVLPTGVGFLVTATLPKEVLKFNN